MLSETTFSDDELLEFTLKALKLNREDAVLLLLDNIPSKYMVMLFMEAKRFHITSAPVLNKILSVPFSDEDLHSTEWNSKLNV